MRSLRAIKHGFSLFVKQYSRSVGLGQANISIKVKKGWVRYLHSRSNNSSKREACIGHGKTEGFHNQDSNRIDRRCETREHSGCPVNSDLPKTVVASPSSFVGDSIRACSDMPNDALVELRKEGPAHID
ncbi:uncharacterized protein G2W53_032741 [Senna tora]|uniref:Uncharacterized protein n=1 Tax=Senna tora TaxID=362788 RepID=A0A834SWZ8_9FABA|nr:uncharacterized protein G2W53_032741 [Senna tora]